MTIHIRETHSCENCGAFYIPYSNEVPCPNCGVVENAGIPYFIPLAVESLRYNKKVFGTYAPPAWYVGSLGDHILNLLFPIFDAYEKLKRKPADFAKFAGKQLSKKRWGRQKYLGKHIQDIAVLINSELSCKSIFAPDCQKSNALLH